MILNKTQITLINEFFNKNPDLTICKDTIINALSLFLRSLNDYNGTLFTCGNGGSYSDSLHIVGELCKSFEMKRPHNLSDEFKRSNNLNAYTNTVYNKLEGGFKAITLGSNPSLKTAIENDIGSEMAFAQELYALGTPSDTLLCISTSGNALNCLLAVETARIIGLHGCVILTGPDGGKLKEFSNYNHEQFVVVRSPGDSTADIQENHIKIWHLWCKLIESYNYIERR